jgi:hypothetical protein
VLKIRLGAVNVQIIGTVKQAGTAVNISSATTHNLILTKPDGTEVTKTGTFYTDGSDGKLYCYSLASDVDQAGIYEVRADLVFPGGTGYDGDTFCGRFQVLNECFERVTDDEVKEILNTTIDTTAFIRAAHVMVENMLASAGLGETTLIEIERWLAAHFACCYDPRETSVTIGNSRADFEGQTGKGLDFTRYGQMVKLLDTSGLLARAGRRTGMVTVASRIELDSAGNAV